MQSVIWVVQFRDGSQVKEIDESGKETVFAGDFLSRRSEFQFLGLRDLVNNLQYSVNLSTGELILNGQAFYPAKELDGRLYRVSHLGLDYAAGCVQYKVSKPITIGENGQVHAESYNIGYKVKLPDGFRQHRRDGRSISYDHVQVMLSIDADSFQPSIGITFTEKIVYDNGSDKMVKI